MNAGSIFFSEIAIRFIDIFFSLVAAKLILQCLGEGLYPAWDAANKVSVRLAEKLGYVYSREYICYGME